MKLSRNFAAGAVFISGLIAGALVIGNAYSQSGNPGVTFNNAVTSGHCVSGSTQFQIQDTGFPCQNIIAQNVTSSNDTNVTVTLGGTPTGAAIQPFSINIGWAGTLAAARLNSNVVQAVTNDTNIQGSISAQTLTFSWAGTLAAARLNSNVVQGVTNDTNITGSITAQNLTLGWTGTLAAARLNSNVVQGVTNDTNIQGSISGQNLTFSWASTLAINRGGTGSGTQQGALNNIAPTPTRAGDIIYYNGTNWVSLAGNNSGTQALSENASGVPAWTPVLTSANPSATAGPNAVNGSASTYMRSDAAPQVQKGTNAQFGIVEGDGSTIGCTSGVCATLPGGGLGFQFNKGGAQQTSIPNETYTQVSWSTTQFNTTGSALTSNRWTAPATGIIILTYSLYCVADCTSNFVGKFIKNSPGTCNGTDVNALPGGYVNTNSSTIVSGTMAVVTQATINDVYELCLYVQTNDGLANATLDGNAAHVYWSGAYLR